MADVYLGPTGNMTLLPQLTFIGSPPSWPVSSNKQMKEADQKVREFAVGEKQGLHEIMIASEKAGISFKLLLQIRNKLLEAYREIMRMQF